MASYSIKASTSDIRAAMEWVGNMPNLATSPDTVINIMDFNSADPTGVAESTTAILTARAVARAAGGGIIVYPPGTFLSSNQDFSKDVGIYHVGSGKGATTIKLKNGANTDLFSAQTSLINLSASFGSGPAGTLYNFGFSNMTIDGNKANQTAGSSYPMRFYGYHYTMENLEIINGYSGEALCDWSGFNNVSPATSMESKWINVETTNSNGNGIQYGGPHDSQFINLIPHQEAGHCIHLGPNAAGSQFINAHPWQPGAGKVAILCEAPGTYWSNCQAESSDTVQVAVLGSGFEWVGGNVFGDGVHAASGFQIGQQGGQTPYSGQILQSAGVTQAYNPTNCKIISRISNCKGAHGPLWLANSGGSNDINITCDQNAVGASFDGAFSASDIIKFNQFGITPDGTRAAGNFFQWATKAFHGFTITDLANDVFNVDTENYALQILQNMALKIYSDQYNTLKMGLNITGNGEMKLGNASSMYSGSGAPSAGTGVNGDFYFRTDTPGTANQRIYVKSAGAWVGIV